MLGASREERGERQLALRARLYPELESETVESFLARMIEEVGHPPPLVERYGVSAGGRRVRLGIKATERLFFFDLQTSDAYWGGFAAHDAAELAAVAGSFLDPLVTIDEMNRRFPRFVFVPTDPFMPLNEVFAAVQASDSAALRTAIESGIEVNAVDYRFGIGHLNTALHHAACTSSHHVRMLLEAGAMVDARDANGWTPLLRAANSQDFDSIRLLVDAGADIDAETNEGYSVEGRTEERRVDIHAFLRERSR